MNFSTEILDKDKNIIVLTFVGRIDIASRDDVKNILHDSIKQAPQSIVVDLSQVGLIDSSGLSALVSGLRIAREANKDFILSGLNSHAQMIFSLTMMDKVFSVYPTADDAVNALTSN